MATITGTIKRFGVGIKTLIVFEQLSGSVDGADVHIADRKSVVTSSTGTFSELFSAGPHQFCVRPSFILTCRTFTVPDSPDTFTIGTVDTGESGGGGGSGGVINLSQLFEDPDEVAASVVIGDMLLCKVDSNGVDAAWFVLGGAGPHDGVNFVTDQAGRTFRRISPT